MRVAFVELNVENAIVWTYKFVTVALVAESVTILTSSEYKFVAVALVAESVTILAS